MQKRVQHIEFYFAAWGRLCLLLLVFCTGCIRLTAQDFHLSQFFNTSLLRNPSLAGVFTGNIRLQAVYRNQWQSIGFPYQTHVLTGEYKFSTGQSNDFMTVGASAAYDVAGQMKLKTLQMMPVINYHKSLSGLRNAYLSGGFSAGITSRQFDGSNLTFDNQFTGGRFNPGAATGEWFYGLSRSFFDIGAGLSINADAGEQTNWYAGVSLWHFHKPEISFLSSSIQLLPKYQLNAGLRSNIATDVVITAEANYLDQGPYTEIIGGAGIMWQLPNNGYYSENGVDGFAVGGGLFMRLNDAVIPYFQLSLNHFDLGLSYDVNTSRLKTASQGRGGFELSLTYRGFAGQPGNAPRSTFCPRF